MKLFRAIGSVLLCAVVQVTPALAAPTMIRLGYSDCAMRKTTDPGATVDNPVTTQYVSGHTQVFFAAKEWLVTSHGAEELAVDGTTKSRAYRIAPGVQMRASENLTISFTMRDVVAGVTTGRSRTFSVLVAVKTVD